MTPTVSRPFTEWPIQQQLLFSPASMAMAMSRGEWRMARHHALVDRKLTALISRKTNARILLINEPPRHGKSEHVSHWLPAWFRLRYPNDYCGVASYSSDFAKDWGRKAMGSATEAAKHFGYRLDRRRMAANHWGWSGFKGGMRTGGIRSGWTGKGLRLFVLDDLVKDDEEAQSESLMDKHWDWFKSTARSRLTPTGVVVVMATRWTKRDITGRILAGDLGHEWPFEHVNLPAIAEENDQLGRQPGEALWPEGGWTAKVLSTYRDGDGSADYWWQALYQQRPTQHERAEWPDRYFEGIWAEEWPHTFELSAIFVDPSKGTEKGDYSAIVFAGLYNGKIYIDSDIRRRPCPEIIADTYRLATDYWPDDVAFETNGFQELLAGDYDDLIEEHGALAMGASMVDHYGVPKIVRIRRIGSYLRRGKIKLRKGSRHNDLLLSQAKAFPMGDHDDGPDALEGVIRRLEHLARDAMAIVDDDRIEP